MATVNTARAGPGTRTWPRLPPGCVVTPGRSVNRRRRSRETGICSCALSTVLRPPVADRAAAIDSQTHEPGGLRGRDFHEESGRRSQETVCEAADPGGSTPTRRSGPRRLQDGECLRAGSAPLHRPVQLQLVGVLIGPAHETFLSVGGVT